MKFTKVFAGYYIYGKWEIIKMGGAWKVSKGLYSPHFTWSPNLSDAKQFIAQMEAK
jgi:hypothetical protein